MTLSQAVALGVLQGIAEFLPISSSGHLALAQNWMPGVEEPSLLFSVVLHLGTLIAIGYVLRARLWKLYLAAVAFVMRTPDSPTELKAEQRWILWIALATLPTAILGLQGRHLVESMNSKPVWIGAAFLATAALLLFSHRVPGGTRERSELRASDALWVGLFQGFGILPGVSRSGSTIAIGLGRRLRPEVAVEFSVLVSVPAVLGANVVAFLDTSPEALRADLGPLAAGFAAASITGIGALKALQWVVTRRRLLPFALYCAVLGVVAIGIG